MHIYGSPFVQYFCQQIANILDKQFLVEPVIPHENLISDTIKYKLN